MAVVGSSQVYLEDKFDTGTQRILNASVLQRFPNFDRQETNLPEELVDFFFKTKERVIRYTNKDDYLAMMKRDSFKQAVCTGADGRISYITCHMFYEDLAILED